MEEKKEPSPAVVAASFVEQYYLILNKSPENAHKFYQEPSRLGWPREEDDAGVLNHVSTLTGIKERIMSSNYKDCLLEINTTDSQESLDGGIIVVVTGSLTGKDNVQKNFSQTFFLYKQDNVFFVLNDILRVFDVCEPRSSTSDDENDQSTNSAPLTSLNFKAAIQNGKVEESEPSCEEVVVPPLECSKPETASHVAIKSTYASVLAKQAVVSAPPSGGTSKAPASPRKVAPNSPKNGGQCAITTSSAYPEAKGIYIGGLPYEITKQEIVDVVKQFGMVRRFSDSVQIRRHEDGFCNGFVEFESGDSARRAVEARRVMFGDKEAYITYKRHYNNTRGTNSRPRSPKTAVQQNGSPRGRESADQWTLHRRGQAKGAPRSSSSDQWRST